MTPEKVTLYKYRDFANLQFALDIFVNQRMFASPFEKLNEPMEGSYRYEPNMLAPYQVQAIYGEKNRWHLLSLGETYNNLLMWSHYAAGHSGMVVGVEVTDSVAEIKPIEYVTDLMIHSHDPDIAKQVLCRKFALWSYERQHRVFKRIERGKNAPTFVDIRVCEVIFGTKTNKELKKLVTKIARQFCPEAKVLTINEAELQTGLG